MSGKAKQNKTTAPEREEKTTELAPIVTQGFWERFSWKDFVCYGMLWFVIFFAITCVCHIGNIISEQRQQINELIDRLNQYEDYTPSPPFDRDEDKHDDLTAWVKNNLPSKCVEERPAVAEVFGNLADMLEAGTLKGENDTFSEGVAQLQPVATRSVWFPFLSKLTKRLKSAKLDADGLAAACRTVSRAIYLPVKKENDSFATNAPLLLLEGAQGIVNATKDAQNAPEREVDKPSEIPKENTNPSLVKPQEPRTDISDEQDETQAETKETAAKNTCPTGNCPNVQQSNASYGYGYGNGNYIWKYW